MDAENDVTNPGSRTDQIVDMRCADSLRKQNQVRDFSEALTAFSADRTAALTGLGFRYSFTKKLTKSPVRGARYASVKPKQ